MIWRTGCINKLPSSKLSTVTEPRGWSLLFSVRGLKQGRWWVRVKGGVNFHLFFSLTILQLLQGVFFSSSRLQQRMGQGGLMAGSAVGPELKPSTLRGFHYHQQLLEHLSSADGRPRTKRRKKRTS